MCFSIKGVEDMKSYRRIEYFILQHLYYSMGPNRMKWYEYNSLVVPRLKEIIKRIAESRHTLFSDRNHTTFQDSTEYTVYDIDAIIKEIKEKYEMFGHYQGYDRVFDSVQQYSWSH